MRRLTLIHRDRLWTTALPLLAYGLLTGPVAQAAATADRGERPNIIIILSDDVGYSDIGCFGGEVRTPALDRLAADGRQFTQAYNASRCCPTRASLLTGLYPHQTGVGGMLFPTEHRGYSEHFAADAVQLAEVLGEAGYGTYLVGKWHLAPRTHNQARDIDYWPTRRGFDRFYGTIAGYGSFWDPSTLYRDETAITPYTDPEYRPATYFYTDAKTDNALAFLQGHAATRGDQPFFLYLSYTAAHWPLHALPEDIEAYAGVYDAGYGPIHAERVRRLRDMDLIPEVGEVAPPTGDWEAVADKPLEAALMATYAGMITHMDRGIGQVVEYLRASGQLDNTLIFYLQDNGSNAEDWFGAETRYPAVLQPMADDALQTASMAPMQTRDGRPVRTGHDVWPGPADTYTALKENWANVSNAPFRKFKHYSHEGGISTPLIVHWPAGIPAADDRRLVRDPVHIIDIMPTCLDAAGVPHPAMRKGVPVQPMEGVSLVPLLAGDRPLVREQPLFWEHESSRAVRDGHWKLVAEEGGHWELYDMARDRGEMHDLALTYPHITDRLAAAWQAWAERARVLPLGGWYDRAGEQTLFLRQGETLPLADSPQLVGRSINMQARVVAGPAHGVIFAYGTADNGMALYCADDAVTLAVRRAGRLESFSLGGLPPPPFKIVASLGARGRVMVGINDRRTHGQLEDGVRQPPELGLSVGHDAGGVLEGSGVVPVFRGRLGVVNARGRVAP
jgi:arylsulfatase A-like enzyme